MKSKKILKYLLIIAAVLVVFSVVGKKAGWIEQGEAMKVTVENAAPRTIIETVAASGKVQPEVEVKISPDVSGEIVELLVKEGDEVKKGQLLCKINPDLYISNQDKMVAAVNTSRANLANAKARLSQVKAQFRNFEATFNRNKKLFDQGAVSQAEYDASSSAFEAAKADVEAAEQSVAAAEFNVKNAQASLTEASDNLSRTTIFSPVNGKVSKLNVEKGERVVGTSQMAGTEIMRIANLNEMEVNVDVNENDIVRLSLGDTADIEVDAYMGRKFKGVVTEIANSANTVGISADQVTNFAVKVRILRESYADLIPSHDPAFSPFRPGMSATVDIHTHTVKNALSVPIQAVTTRTDSTVTNKNEDEVGKEDTEVEEVVFVDQDGIARLKKVKTGVQDNNFIEIVSGLSKADKVITGPYSAVSKSLKDSVRVTVVKKEELFAREEE